MLNFTKYKNCAIIQVCDFYLFGKGVFMHAMLCLPVLWSLEDNWKELVLSFYVLVPRIKLRLSSLVASAIAYQAYTNKLYVPILQV